MTPSYSEIFYFSQYLPCLNWSFLGILPFSCIISQPFHRKMSSWLTGNLCCNINTKGRSVNDRGADIKFIASGWVRTGEVKSYFHWDWEIHTLPQIIALLMVTEINA